MFTGGCDFGDVTVPHSAENSQAGVRTIGLPGGRRVALLAIRGRGGAPRVAVTGPKSFAVAGTPAGAVLTDRAYLLESPQEATTYVTAGDVRRARSRPGAHARHRPWRPRLRFRPALATKGRRSVVAVVSYRGVPREQRRAARFRMGPVHVARPRRLRTHHAGHRRLTVRWRHRGGAVGFDVRLALRDGRRLLRVAGPHARHVRFRGIGRHDRGKLTVIAHGLGRDAARARARVRR